MITDLKLKTRLISDRSKIIALTIPSRHKRGKKPIQIANIKYKKPPEVFKTTYKIFIQYLPNVNNYRSIKSNYIFKQNLIFSF
jgi:hypothetical protein